MVDKESFTNKYCQGNAFLGGVKAVIIDSGCAFLCVGTQSHHKDSWDLSFFVSISPRIPLVPSVSEQTCPGSHIQTNIMSSEPMKEMLSLPPLQFLCHFWYIPHYWARPFCIITSCPDLTCPSKSWIDLILPQGPMPSLPFSASASPLYLMFLCMIHVPTTDPTRVSVSEWQDLSILDLYTPVTTSYILAAQ